MLRSIVPWLAVVIAGVGVVATGSARVLSDDDLTSIKGGANCDEAKITSTIGCTTCTLFAGGFYGNCGAKAERTCTYKKGLTYNGTCTARNSSCPGNFVYYEFANCSTGYLGSGSLPCSYMYSDDYIDSTNSGPVTCP